MTLTWNGELDAGLVTSAIEELKADLEDLRERNVILRRRLAALESPLAEDLLYIHVRGGLCNVEIDHYPDGANEPIGTTLMIGDKWVAVAWDGRRAKQRFDSRIMAGAWLRYAHNEAMEAIRREPMPPLDPCYTTPEPAIPDPFAQEVTA
jgi:hypothetical protein